MPLGALASSRQRPESQLPGQRRKTTISCLAAVCILYVALASFYSLRTPAWESNDEDSHVQYVTYLRVHGKVPPIEAGNGIEVHQPPLYYAIVGAWGSAIGIPAFRPDLPPSPSATIRSPLQVSHDYSPSQRVQARRLHLLRLPSVIFGLMVVAAAFTTALILTGSAAAAAATGATVALWPRFLVITGTVNNDSLAYAACAWALVFVLQWMRTHRLRWCVGAGVAFAVAALTKQTTLPVVGVLVVALVASAVRHRSWRGPTLAAIVFAAGSSWWYIRNLVEHGDLLASEVTSRYLREMLPPLIRPNVTFAPIGRELRGRLVTSLWYGAGWNQIELPTMAGIVLSLLAVAAVIAAIWRGRDVLEFRWLLLGCVGGGLVAWALLVAQTTQNEGRYLFVAISALATLVVVGPVAAFRARSPLALVATHAVWPVLLIGLNMYVFCTWLIPYGGL